MKHYRVHLLLTGALFGLASNSSAATGLAAIVPVEMSMTAYLIIGALLITSIMMFFLFQRRFHVTAKELSDISAELGTTRQRLVETSHQLEITKGEHKATTERYSNILFEANVGVFQMDLAGKCTFVNTALQEMSGLYPKKALKEGIEIAIHPEDREDFVKAWDEFVETKAAFNHSFRFSLSKGKEVRVTCRANKVINAKKDVESYIGWVSDVTAFHEQQLVHQAETARFEHFVSETIEGFYRLEPKAPVAMESDSGKVAETIMNEMTLADCNDTFAAMYGAKPSELIGKAINELKNGCGPFRSNETIQSFVDAGYKSIDLESVRQDPSGNRLNLTNNVVGIVEDDKLVGVWGTQRNISQQKREKAELTSQADFMKRVLNSLPADVHVKDTRCRYLYASKKLADRTGIPQQEWIGKTIFEVMPATPREHDQNAIDTMKSGKSHRSERTFEARGKSGWMETIQTPLVSEEELVEGVIALSFDISDRKKKEEETRHYRGELEKQLKHTKGELAQSRVDYGRTATTLSETIQKMKVIEAERANREHEFQEHLNERKRAEETLRRGEQSLLAHQEQLQRQLADRLRELDAETDKRRKWEELIAIKEDELRKLEEHTAALNAHYEREISRREQAETSLETGQRSLEKARRELNELSSTSEREIERLKTEHKQLFDAEQDGRDKAEKQLERVRAFYEDAQKKITSMTEKHAQELEKAISEREASAAHLANSVVELEKLTANRDEEIGKLKTEHESAFNAERQTRAKAEKNLKRTAEFLDAAREQIKRMTDQHADELENEVAERKAAAEKLIQSMEELDELRQRFSQRLDEETKTIKQELAKKQIREKALRQHEKDLEKRIQELESTLQMKAQEYAEQLQAREGAEVEKQQIEERLEQLTERQQELVDRETQRLHLNIAEIRLAEVKLRKFAGDLEQNNEQLQETLKARDAELERTRQEMSRTEAALAEIQAELKQLAGDQDRLLAKETGQLKHQLAALEKAGQDLNHKLEDVRDEKKSVERTLEAREIELQQSRQEIKSKQTALSEAEANLLKLSSDRDEVIERATKQLTLQLEATRKAGEDLNAKIEDLKSEKQVVASRLEERDADLTQTAREYREVVDAYKESQTKLKELSESQEALVARATGELNAELRKHQHAEKVLKEKEAELTDRVVSQREELNKLNDALKAAADQRAQTERQLGETQLAFEASQDNADALILQQTQDLKAEIEQFKLNEESLKQQLIAAEQSVVRRDEALADLKEEQAKTTERLEELETKLAGIKEEHQLEVKKSLAEVKEVFKANSALVDELDEAVRASLNPVVKSAVIMEQAENLTAEQKKELAKTNLHCRTLIDTMNYRAELTHVADGSDEVEPDECDLHMLITDIDHQFCHRAETKKLFFAVSFAQYQAGGNVPKWVDTDEGKLRKVLSILLGYAIDRVEKGRVGLHATRLNAENGIMDIAFELTYTPAESNDKLLTGVFASGEESGIDMKYGLTLARQYVSMMGGETSLERRDAGVTALTITLPFKRGASAIIMPESDSDEEKRMGAA